MSQLIVKFDKLPIGAQNLMVSPLPKAEKTHSRGGKITVWLVSSLTRLDRNKKENMWLSVCSEAADAILVKLETSRTMILPPTVSVLCLKSEVTLPTWFICLC